MTDEERKKGEKEVRKEGLAIFSGPNLLQGAFSDTVSPVQLPEVGSHRMLKLGKYITHRIVLFYLKKNVILKIYI